ncbi:hypothetical protein [Thermococcus sp.]
MRELHISDVLPIECILGSTIAIVYDTYSSAWQIPLVFLKYVLEREGFGVISNYTLPLQSLIKKAASIGLDVKRELFRNRMAIIDLFGTRYFTVKPDLPNVFYLDKVEPETINPKIERIYSIKLSRAIGKRPVIRVIYTLDGAAMMLGEDHTLKLLNQTLAYSNSVLRSSTLILSLNQDVVSKKFVAWTSSVSDVILAVKSFLKEGEIKEYLYVTAAPCEDFEPAVYLLRVTRKKGIERFKIRKVGSSASELRPSAEE